MKRIIKQVTVTGADDSVRASDLVAIQRQYPFVEWGILLSKSSEGRSRFPSADWIEGLWAVRGSLELSGHLCGRWVRDICDGTNTFYEDRPKFEGLFHRIQLNFHSYIHRIDSPVAFVQAVASLGVEQVIFQFDRVNDGLMRVAADNEVNAVPLFDTSGGAGILPSEWPEALEVYSGYAGGLSPENLSEQMGCIVEKCNDGPIWIDAETWLRSDADRQFDLEKVCKFLQEAEPWVIQQR
jgi:hypothetical protein